MFEQEGTTQQESSEGADIESGAGDAAPAAPEVLDLGSVEKFKFEGREWTPQELRNAYLMERDYRQKTSQLAEQRKSYEENKKYYEALPIDLEHVRNNPALADQFRAMYPKTFHRYLDQVAGKSPQAGNPVGSGQTQAYDPVLERLNRVEQQFFNQEVKAIQAELDAKFEQFTKRYPYADEEAVIARAQHLDAQGEKLTDLVWDQLWKSSNERNQKLAEAHYSAQVKAQKTTNQKSKDVPSGGGIPGPKAKLPKTIKEASELALQEMQGL